MKKKVKVTQEMVDWVESHREGKMRYDKEFWLELGEEIVVEKASGVYFHITLAARGGGCMLPAHLFDIDPVTYNAKLEAEEARAEEIANTNWTKVRNQAAIEAMTQLINREGVDQGTYLSYELVARNAVKYADALVKELQKV